MSEATLPALDALSDFRSLASDSGLWLPAVRDICRRHGVDVDNLVRLGEGSNIVFQAGELILKLFPPHWATLAAAEMSVTRHVKGRLGIATPAVYAHGAIDEWPYLITSRVPGQYLSEVWDGLELASKLRLATQLGEVLARLHGLPTADLVDVPQNWPALMRDRMEQCVAHHRARGAADPWIEQITGFLEGAQPLYPRDFRPALLSTDVHQYHLTIEPDGSGWRLSGIFDFDDALIGYREYDLSSPGLFMMRGRPELLRSFLTAYGLPRSELTGVLSRRLLAYTLLHRYRDLSWILDDLIGNRRLETLDELAQAIYGLE